MKTVSCMFAGAVAAIIPCVGPGSAHADTVEIDCVLTQIISSNREFSEGDRHWRIWAVLDKNEVVTMNFPPPPFDHIPPGSFPATITPTTIFWNLSNVGTWSIDRTNGNGHYHFSAPDNLGQAVWDYQYQCAKGDVPLPGLF